MCKNCGSTKSGPDIKRCIRCGGILVATITVALTMPFAKAEVRHPDDEKAPAPYVNILVQAGPAMFAAQAAITSNAAPFVLQQDGNLPVWFTGWPEAVAQSTLGGDISFLPPELRSS